MGVPQTESRDSLIRGYFGHVQERQRVASCGRCVPALQAAIASTAGAGEARTSSLRMPALVAAPRGIYQRCAGCYRKRRRRSMTGVTWAFYRATEGSISDRAIEGLSTEGEARAKMAVETILFVKT